MYVRTDSHCWEVFWRVVLWWLLVVMVVVVLEVETGIVG